MYRFLALPIALLATYATAQTTTTCDPTKVDCPNDPALGTTFETTFNETMTEFDPNFFNLTAGTDLVSFSENGADMTIVKQGDSVTVETAFYIMFGSVEIIMQAAKGQGIISTLVFLSDDLDEIDIEIMGGNTTNISNNFYGQGNTTQFNSEYPTVNWPGGAMGGFHNFTVNWSQDQIEWFYDGESVRTEPYQPPGLYPQTPCYIKFGLWAGGDPSNPPGTVKWAGGPTDYSDGPFTMTVQSMKVIDSHQNTSYYHWGDKSGSYESIDAIAGQSPVYQAMHEKTTSQKIDEQWSGLSTGAKIGIGCGVSGVFLIAFIAFIFYCVKQRRQGKAEKALADKEWDAQHAELMEYRNRMKHGAFAVSHLRHGEKF